MDPELFRSAALTRSQSVRARADRPSKRSSGFDTDESARVHARLRDVKFIEREDVAGPATLNFTGYASVTDTPYEMYDWYGPYSETIEPGAFKNTLKQLDLDVPLVLQHDALRRIARTTNRTLRLAEDDHGLFVDADLDPTDVDVAYIRPKIESLLIDEMSFKFRIVEGWWSEDFTEFVIKEVDIHRGDVAIVAYGANPYTKGLDLAAARTSAPPVTTKRGADLISLEDIRVRVA